MDNQGIQEKKLIVAFENIKRLTTRPQSTDSVPHGEFLMMFVINSVMKQTDPEINATACPGVMISKLSDLLQISRPTASQMITTLEEKGYVDRIACATDRRIVYICLTEKGQMVFSTKMAIYSGFLTEIIEKVGREEIDQLISLCERFHSAVGEIRDRHLSSSSDGNFISERK